MHVNKIDLIDDQILRLKILFLLKSFLLLCQRKCWKKNVKTAVVYKLDGMGAVLGTSPIDLSQILTYTSTATEIKFMRDFYVDVWREKNLES
jgi:hypothetical protein